MPVSLSISEIGLSATICLNMIVKNEAHIIIETLNNLCHYIPFAYWVISDTGSTDDTKKLIRDFFADKKIPGELVEHEWQDFAYNRTKALECAFGKTDYLLIFDADDSIQGNFKLPTIYNIDKYQVQFGPGFVYTRPLLITNKKRWCFKGVLHETLANIDYMNGEVVLEGDYYVISGRAGNRSKNPNKYFDDAIVLKNAFEKELHVDYGMACRYAFYCAQSYKDAGVAYTDESIMWYQKCLDLGNWDQEKYYSCLMLGGLYTHKNDMVNALKYWFKSCEYDTERIECIVSAINYLRSTSQNMFVNSLYHRFKGYKRANKLVGKLFVLETNFNDELEYHNSIVAYYVGDKASGYDCCKKIIINNVIGYPLLKSTMINILFYKELLESDLNTLDLFYAYDNAISRIYLENDIGDPKIFEVWQLLFLKNRDNLTKYIGMGIGMGNKNTALFNHINNIDSINLTKSTIFMSFTTCKRLDLFKQTINSMINHWTDINKIDYWFCVDDNSAEEDRTSMRTLYPWIDYHMKSLDGKGHRASMNIIWNKLNDLKPTYWIHMEDDFLFHNKMNYIEEAIKGLTSPEFLSNNVNQILFNRNYGETIDQYTVGGHLVNGSHKPFVLHDYNLRQYNYPTCHYWPHYSFRPSMTKTSIVLGLGNFDSPNQFFEMDYANKWTGAGNKSGFFNKITNRHIGRLTSDKDTRIVKNAYELNQESQFLGGVITVDPVSVFNSKSIKIINLERRPDRKAETIGKLDAVGISSNDYEFINGVDGLKLVPTLELKKLFEGNDFGSRRGFIGCAMSHYNLWKQLLDDDKNEYYVIMEDDFTFCPDFKTRYTKLLDSGVFKQYDVLFLGYHMFESERNKVLDVYNNFDNADVTSIKSLNKQLFVGATHCYTINKTGARKMIDYIAVNGIKHGIDYVIKLVPSLNCFETQPQLSFAEWNEDGKNIDTDIQSDFVGLDFNNIVDDVDKFIFIPLKDQIDNDMYCRNETIPKFMRIALDDDKCVGFNTLGFFKHTITDLTKSRFFGSNDGIYIKRQHYENMMASIACNDSLDIQEIKGMIELPNIDESSRMTITSIIYVKMLCNWTTSEQLCKEWSNMCDDPDEFRWKDIRLTWTDDVNIIDYYVIINFPPPNTYYDPKKTIVFQMEPWVNDPTKNWGVKTWGEWAVPDPVKFLKVYSHKTHLNNVQWQINYPLPLLQNNVDVNSKVDVISSICSNKNFDDGHILRNNFIKYIDNDNKIKMNIFGRENYHGFSSYTGVLPDDNKIHGLMPYKYYFMCENNSEYNYATEKIWEPILCECLCFYWGCPNLEEYIDSSAFVRLPLDNFEESYNIIVRAITEDWWSQRIDIIRREKQKILNKLGFFPTIGKLIIG